MILASRYVVPVDGPVIENGAVAFDRGVITAVGKADELLGRLSIDYGDAVICPGFVNAHTHLELTSLAGRVPPSPDFTGWLRRLIAVAGDDLRSEEYVRASVAAGIEQSLAAGVTTVGDITRSPEWTRPVLLTATLRAVSFGEVIAIGRRRYQLVDRLAAASLREQETEHLRSGISPHAPYSVEPDALRACACRAREIEAPLCIHAAETPDEEEFTLRREGPLAEHLRKMDVWDEDIPTVGCRPLTLLDQTGLLGPRTILAHANYVSDSDIRLIAQRGASVAYCPRTHRAFGHAPHRFREMVAAGINVAIGTDSLASNPSLSVLEELRAVRASCPAVAPDLLLAMGTLHGASALGWAELTGSLSIGKAADIVVVLLPRQSRTTGWRAVLQAGDSPIAVYWNGRQVR